MKRSELYPRHTHLDCKNNNSLINSNNKMLHQLQIILKAYHASLLYINVGLGELLTPLTSSHKVQGSIPGVLSRFEHFYSFLPTVSFQSFQGLLMSACVCWELKPAVH